MVPAGWQVWVSVLIPVWNPWWWRVAEQAICARVPCTRSWWSGCGHTPPPNLSSVYSLQTKNQGQVGYGHRVLFWLAVCDKKICSAIDQ